jgi:predicted RecA/RadA family phage recombinase
MAYINNGDSGATVRAALNKTVEVYSLDSGEAFAAGDAVYLKSDGKWWTADNTDEATAAGLVGIAIDEATAADEQVIVRLRGPITTTGLTAGSTYYLGEGGALTTTAPDAVGSVVRVMGVALSTTELYLDQTYLAPSKIASLYVAGLDAQSATVNLGDGVTPDLPLDAIILDVIVVPASGSLDASEWDLIRSDGSSDDVLSVDAQDTAKRILKLRGNTANAALANVKVQVYYGTV